MTSQNPPPKRPHEMRPFCRQYVQTFKVAAVSSNTNSFGLKQMIVMTADGDTWKVHANQLNVREVGELIEVSVTDDRPQWELLGFEIPSHVGEKAPEAIIKEVWTPKKLMNTVT